jgi:hypothetical protein
MSVHNAKLFIIKCRNDPVFRRQVYRCTSTQEVLCAAAKAEMNFTNIEAARAFSELKTQAQDDEELDELSELKIWYEMQTGGEEPDPLSACFACTVRSTCSNYHELRSAETPEEIQLKPPAEDADKGKL